jgi:hypothetical protein
MFPESLNGDFPDKPRPATIAGLPSDSIALLAARKLVRNVSNQALAGLDLCARQPALPPELALDRVFLP